LNQVGTVADPTLNIESAGGGNVEVSSFSVHHYFDISASGGFGVLRFKGFWI
jgi:hypothetical protein